MKKLLLILTVVIFCSPLLARVKLVQATIDPAVASGGDQVKCVVVFSGIKDLQSVKIIPREYAYEIPQPFALERDETAAKETWTLQTMVPYEVMNEKVNLEIKAFDKKGNEIVIKEYKDQTYGKAGLIEFEVR
jgi:hypothetical protein